MNAKKLLTTRRSVRKYKDELVERDLIKEIIDVTRFYPSWANTQVARFHIIQNPEMITKIAESAVKGFVYNQKTLKYAKNVLVISYVQGKSGQMKGYDVEQSESNKWEIFDSAIACQQFSLAAYSYGVGSTIFGVINEDEIAKIIDLPENETVSTLLTFGYTDEEPATPPRKSVEEITNFIK